MSTRFVLVLIISLFSGGLFAQLNIEEHLESCNLTGSISLYDYNAKQWTFSDPSDAKRPTMPASTFKIFNTLLALEKGAVKNADEIIPWDQEERGFKSWNQDLNLRQAYQYSALWFYQEIARRLGSEEYAASLKCTQYGNMRCGGAVDEFWVNDTLQISPAQQILFLVRLYEERFEASPKAYDITKEIMLAEEGEGYLIRAKTGWGQTTTRDIGWWIGWVENEGEIYFFATRLEKPITDDNPGFPNCRKEITRTVLSELGWL